MLYDGCIRFALQARDAIERKDYETSYERLKRAQDIVLEMLAGLNYEVNAELCKRVASIYNFLYRKLVDASVQRNINAIDDAVRVLRIERETWHILVEKVNKARAEVTGPQALSDAAEQVPASMSKTRPATKPTAPNPQDALSEHVSFSA